MNMDQQVIYGTTCVACTAFAAAHDLYDRRIPNVLTGTMVTLGLALHFILGGWGQVASSAGAGIVAGAIFLLFFLAGGMGGGDVKLMAGVGCLVGFINLEQVMITIVLCGAISAVVMAFHKGVFRQTILNAGLLFRHHQTQGFRAHPELNIRNHKTVRLPYGVSIAAGCLVTFCELATKGASR